MMDPPLDRARDHVRGPEGVPVLVEYGDFECPYCGDAFRSVEKVLGRMDGRVAFAWRHFPIVARHPHAGRAAEAAEAAAAQGRFWEMYELLLTNQKNLEDADLAGYAERLGLDTQRFEEDLRSGRWAGRVDEDIASGERSGVDGTPAFFIDGQKYGGFYDIESLTWALEDAGA